jgi:phenylalanyl-tRNA synthetase alpha chain
MEAPALGVCIRPRSEPPGFSGRLFYWPRPILARSTTKQEERSVSHGISCLSPERLDRYLALRDLTDPDQGLHAINILMNELIAAVVRWSGLPADIARRPPVVLITDNYDRLFYEPDAIARSARYSHYIDDIHMLRTHTTAGIPPLLAETRSDRLIVCPGLVYRRDVVDRLHVGEPHQVDLWIARQGRLRRAHLLEMIAAVVETVLPGQAYRCNETIHPYTMNGLEVEVRIGERWVEVLECGEIHPWLLNDNNLPSQEWSGLAMGVGLDRLIMLIKQIDDIRLLRSSDPRIAKQMLTLARYEAVSNQPATHRDLSICVDDPDMELLGDRIRNVLGKRSGWVENVELLQASDYASVPEKARERLGMSPSQHNLLVRVTLRSLDGSISKEDANRVYDLVYSALHEGTSGYFRN